MSDITPHVERNGGLSNIYPSAYERELQNELNRANREIARLRSVVNNTIANKHTAHTKRKRTRRRAELAEAEVRRLRALITKLESRRKPIIRRISFWSTAIVFVLVVLVVVS